MLLFLRMHFIQRITIKQQEAATLLKNKVIRGEINEKQNKHQSATLRRLMNEEVTHKPSRQIILSKKKEIELMRFRVILLYQEKSRKIVLLRNKTQNRKTLYDENCLKSKLFIHRGDK